MSYTKGELIKKVLVVAKEYGGVTSGLNLACCAEIEERIPLIAAAPGLLAACKIAILALTHKPINPDDIKFIEKAIAEAE